jgi:hypothetical protein
MKNILRYCVVVIVLSCCLLAITLPVWCLLNQLGPVRLLYVFLYFLLYGACIALLCIVLPEPQKNIKSFSMYCAMVSQPCYLLFWCFISKRYLSSYLCRKCNFIRRIKFMGLTCGITSISDETEKRIQKHAPLIKQYIKTLAETDMGMVIHIGW